jgi:hypothetical protein
LPWIHTADLPPGYIVRDGNVVDGVRNLNIPDGEDEDGLEDNNNDQV